MCCTTYQKTVSNLHEAYGLSALQSMKRAAEEAPASGEQPHGEDVKHVQASFDGTWQRRGFSSRHGVVTSISGGKCVDVAVLSKECIACKNWEKRKGTDKYNEWVNMHVCPINHHGSAGAMEAVGAVTIFKRSIQQNKLRYLTYRGDGDSKSYSEVVKSDPHPGYAIRKAECVGHVQKRVGSRLRNLRVSMKGKKLRDGKGLCGKGRLTDKIINTLQNYYGNCIRSNKGNLYGMKKGIAAIIHHCSENPNSVVRHQYCSRRKDTWCKYHRVADKESYKPRINLPPAISQIIRPIFSHTDLGADALLSRCLDGKTQNANEALNQLIWKRCTKDIFVGKQILDIAVFSAVLQYNNGGSGLLEVFEKLGLRPGNFMRHGLIRATRNRICLANKKSSQPAKLARKKLSAIKKGYADERKRG